MNKFFKSIKNLVFPTYPEPKVSTEEALEILKSLADEKGWTWREPVEINSKRGKWMIWTHHGIRGVNVRGEIDQQTGEILEAGFMPR
ncbi:MAG: hypothetical protein DWQ07_16225 [Chloroflexi bacterium]|nr:MAG: hypothetical protein DWQ07_16225 [Chloroflexota bacterium]MBL1195299.1 hypothetical protein [Chloroflexota bacterium]NOH12583.1 hypothetical protein [Chloroflexota bacterium]